MNETSKKKNWLAIIGGCVLILVMFFGIKFIFGAMEIIVPKTDPAAIVALPNGMSSDFALYTGTVDQFDYSMGEQWYDQCKDTTEGYCYLYGEGDGGRVILVYLPEYDRVLTASDMTIEYKTGADGGRELVLRIRTAEDSQNVQPQEQVLCLLTQVRDEWDGDLRVILDGREQECASRCMDSSGRLFWSY